MKRANGGTHKNHIYQTAVSGFVDKGTNCYMVNYKSCITSHVSCPHQKQAVHSHSLVIKKKDDKLKKYTFLWSFHHNLNPNCGICSARTNSKRARVYTKRDAFSQRKCFFSALLDFWNFGFLKNEIQNEFQEQAGVRITKNV